MPEELKIGDTPFDAKRLKDFEDRREAFRKFVEEAILQHNVTFGTHAGHANFVELVAHNCAFEAVTR